MNTPSNLRLFRGAPRFVCATIGLPLLLACLPLAHAQTVLIDFSSATSITDNLNKGTIINTTGNGLASLGNITYSATTGLGGGGGGQPPPATGDIFMYGTKQAFAPTFTTATTSAYVQIKAGTNTGAGLALTMGFSNSSLPQSGNGAMATGTATSIPAPVTLSGTTLTGANQYSIAVDLRETTSTVGGSDTYNFVVYNNGGTTAVGSSASISLTAGDWYFWTTTYVNNGDGTLSLTASLFASDANGTVVETSLLTYSLTVSNDSLLSGDLYGFISSQNGDRRGIAQLDNVSFSATTAVPEPADYAAIFGVLGLACAFVARRIFRR